MTYLRKTLALRPQKPKRAVSRPAEPAPSPAVVRLQVRLKDRAQRIVSAIRTLKKAKLPAKTIASRVGAFSPKPRLASWRRRVFSRAEGRARTRKRRQVMRRESRRANR